MSGLTDGLFLATCIRACLHSLPVGSHTPVVISLWAGSTRDQEQGCVLHGADSVSEAEGNGPGRSCRPRTQPRSLSSHPIHLWVVYAKPHAKCWRDSEYDVASVWEGTKPQPKWSAWRKGPT